MEIIRLWVAIPRWPSNHDPSRSTWSQPLLPEDQLHNLWGPVQKENMVATVQTLFRILTRQQQSIKPSTESRPSWDLCDKTARTVYLFPNTTVAAVGNYYKLGGIRHKFIFLQSGVQKHDTGLSHWVKIKVLAGPPCFLDAGRDNIFSRLFQYVKATHLPWFMALLQLRSQQ